MTGKERGHSVIDDNKHEYVKLRELRKNRKEGDNDDSDNDDDNDDDDM